MQIDNITYYDLSIFNKEDSFSVFSKLDLTRTTGGRDHLFTLFNHPFSDIQKISETQEIIRIILRNSATWPVSITNGTMMVMERFYESALDHIPTISDPFKAILYKILHGPDYSLIRYSIGHFADFIRGLQAILLIGEKEITPPMLTVILERVTKLLDHELIRSLANKKTGDSFTPFEVVQYGGFIRNRFKNSALELLDIFGKLDAWYSMAMATQHFHFVLPDFIESHEPFLEAASLHHILLANPVAYNLNMQKENHFLFLTGANMAGKSTFIKAVGCALFLAHLGMGVPATHLRLSIFEGIVSNINVVDNIEKGESYFFNEVQRIKNTIHTINDQRKWLVLIDELFKGTNVQDAMKCSSVVIKGLLKINNALFILSTHLYEIGEELKQYPNISFKFFETKVNEEQLAFNYQLKDGISNDRIGYLILKREKVVEMLDKL